tara:strand:+ start:7731 stop:8543 length:813 start_codon:yes stop_codon:yes gene_type:complete
MRLVLTGASGFIGSRLYTFLKEQLVTDQVVGASRAKISSSDYAIFDSYEDCPSGDLLIHTAENSNLGQVEGIGEAYLIGQREIAESLASKFPRVIYLSSSILYGNKTDGPLAENAAIQQDSWYQKSKKAVEEAFMSNTEAVILRLSNIYGGDFKRGTVIYDIAKQMDATEIQLQVLNAKRDFLHVDDLSQLILKIINSFCPGVFNVGYGESYSAEELAEVFFRCHGVSKKVSGKRIEGISNVVINNTKISDTFSWNPCITIENGIQGMLD